MQSNVIYVDSMQWQTLIELKRSIAFFKKDYKYQRSLEKKQNQFYSLLGDITHQHACT